MCFLWPCQQCYKKARRKARKKVEEKRKVKHTSKPVEDPAAKRISIAPDSTDRAELAKSRNSHILQQPSSQQTGAMNAPQSYKNNWAHQRRRAGSGASPYGVSPHPVIHNIKTCPCPQCVQTRNWEQANNPASKPEPDEDAAAPGPSQARGAPSLQSFSGYSSYCDQEPRRSLFATAHNPAIVAAAVANMDPGFASYPQLYICPRSAPHTSFPVIDYSTTRWDPSTTPWPHLYMAVVLDSVNMCDLVDQLAPRESGLLLSARSSETGECIGLGGFADIPTLRCHCYQLEVRDAKEKDGSKAAAKGTRKKTSKEQGREGLANPFGFGGPWFGVQGGHKLCRKKKERN